MDQQWSPITPFFLKKKSKKNQNLSFNVTSKDKFIYLFLLKKNKKR
jgi:hypothetical protein